MRLGWSFLPHPSSAHPGPEPGSRAAICSASDGDAKIAVTRDCCRRKRVSFLACALPLALIAGPASAEPAPGVGVELNKLEPVEKNCRATLVIENRGDTAYDELRLDLVVFDDESIVAKRLIVDVAPLAARKTAVKTFDIADLGCDRIGRLLLNDVTACGGADNCLGLVEASSRAATPFIK